MNARHHLLIACIAFAAACDKTATKPAAEDRPAASTERETDEDETPTTAGTTGTTPPRTDTPSTGMPSPGMPTDTTTAGTPGMPGDHATAGTDKADMPNDAEIVRYLSTVN